MALTANRVTAMVVFVDDRNMEVYFFMSKSRITRYSALRWIQSAQIFPVYGAMGGGWKRVIRYHSGRRRDCDDQA
jgi:hypothetical protein